MIRVKLRNASDRRYFMAIWSDPITGKIKSRSTRTTVRREAERFAGRLEDELNAGTYKPPSKTEWDEFRQRYMDEAAGSHTIKSKQKKNCTFNAIEKWKKPLLVNSVSASYISEFSAHLRGRGLAESSIAGHLSVIRKSLNWAANMELIPKAPKIEFPELGDPSKGRAVTLEEFERMLMKTPDVVRPEFVENWKHYQEGMWLSGLRLEESMLLHWTNDKYMTPDFSRKYPMLRIQSLAEKGKSFRLLPITPDFAEFLARTPAGERKGYVFNPYTVQRGKRSGKHRPTANHVGRVVCSIGELAGVKVSETKFASLHDLRRSFGERWALKVMPKVLQELMRHESIQTTMTYYVGKMSEDTAEAVWKAAQPTGNTFGNSQPISPSRKDSEIRETL